MYEEEDEVRTLAPDFARIAALDYLGVIVTAPGAPMAYRTWQSGDDWSVLIAVTEQPARRRLVREITTFRRVGARALQRDDPVPPGSARRPGSSGRSRP